MVSIKLTLVLTFVGLCICDQLLFETTTWPQVLYNLEELKEEQLWNTDLFELDRIPQYSGVGVYNWRKGNGALLDLLNAVQLLDAPAYDDTYYRYYYLRNSN
jgi:hypothetical protein